MRRFTACDEQALGDIMTNPAVYQYLGMGLGFTRDAVGGWDRCP